MRHYYSGKGAKGMQKEKQHMFSARTTEGGLKALNELKGKLNCSWDDLVIDAVNAYHGVEIPKVPKRERAPRPKRRPKNRKGQA
jgi:hypothetical protein